jgi:uncharacterized damage-inducible protein DinB
MKRLLLVGIIVSLVLSVSAAAQCAATMSAKTDAPKTSSTNSAFKTEFFTALDHLEKETVALAEQTPQEKYSWKPANGGDARSTGEVFMHMAGGNYSYARMMGATVPADVNPKEFEKSANDKAKTIDTLKKSFAFLRQTAQNLSDADMDKAAKIYNRTGTVREVLLIAVTHQSEHLGQSIAYNRSMGLVPQWTTDRQAAQSQQKPAADASKK